MSAGSRRFAIIGLTTITALIHLVVLNVLLGQISPPFVLNGIGFFVLLYAYLNKVPAGREGLVRFAFIAFTLVTILAWVAIGDKSDPLGWFTKAVEALLLIVLWTDR